MLRRVFYQFAFFVALIAAGQTARAASDSPVPIDVTDPRMGEILFHYYQDDYVPAIARLRAARQQGELDVQAVESELLLANMLLANGNHLEAASIFERLSTGSADREIRDPAWLSLAQTWHRLGYSDRAQEALHHMSENLPEDLSREARLLQAQIFIDSGQYDRTIALLQAWDDTNESASYARYNLSVALLRAGQVDAAVQNLDVLGTVAPVNEELTALRDRANLTLGYLLLREEQPQAARAALQRIRLGGPFSNKALLGLGWADARLGNFESAREYWMRLRERDFSDPAVLESMLAVPYALTNLDSITQAAGDYRSAIEAFEAETNRIDRAIGFLESDEQFDEFLSGGYLDGTGSRWQFAASPQIREVRYMVDTLATHEFHEGIRNYQNLSSLDDSLETWQRDVDVYASVLESRKAAYARMLPRIKDTLAQADFNDILSRQRRFAGILDNVERFNDWLALAHAHEFDSWRKISRAASSPALAANNPAAEQLREKIRWLKGMLQWELERNAQERLHQSVRDLRQIGDLLTEAEQRYAQIDHTMRALPTRFAELGEQTDALAQRIGAMRTRVAETKGSQQAFLQSIVVDELLAKKARLNSYTLQARLALVEIYELPNSSGGGGD